MIRILRKLHTWYFLFCIAFSFTILYPLVFFYSRKPVNLAGMNWTRYIFSRFGMMMAGFIPRYHFKGPRERTRNYVVCANHASNLDIPALILLMKKNFVFMGKEELADNYVTGIYFRAVDIPLNRRSKMSSFRAFKKAEEALRAGRDLLIFPEGMIGESYPPALHPFKNGPFRLAIELGVPVLPVSFPTNWKLMWDDGSKYGSKPGICDIYVHAPIETASLNISDADELKDRVYAVIKSRLEGYASPGFEKEI